MKKIYNKFLIVSTIFLLVGGVYLYSSRDINSGNIVPTAFGASLVSSNGTPQAPANPSLSADISSDIAFLTTLVSLEKIKMDTTIFTLSSFKSLKNNSVKIDPVEPGRANPFAPISATETANVVAAPAVVTDPATDITDKTAVFNGTVNSVATATDTYFEYGTVTPALNLGQIQAKVSLVGTFLKNVTGLTPKTSYFYKACAKINNIANCGEVITFTTN